MKDAFSPNNENHTPFKRGKSRVYYESDLNRTPVQEIPSSLFNSDREPLSPFSSSPTNSIIVSVMSPPTENKPTMSAIRKSVSQKLVSTYYPSPSESPVDSWRDIESSGLRCSPSQRSQDSGYSDSGESNAGYNPDPSETTPVVKHVTRVYFGEEGRPSAVCNDSSVISKPLAFTEARSVPCQRVYRTAKRRCSKRYSIQENDFRYGSSSNSAFKCEPQHSRPQSIHFDENVELLEHKSLSSEKLPSPKSKNCTPVKKLFTSFLSDWKLFAQHEFSRLNNSLCESIVSTSTKVSTASSVTSDTEKAPVARRRSSENQWPLSELGRCSTPIDHSESSKSLPLSFSGESISKSPSPIPRIIQQDLKPYMIANETRNGALSQWLDELQGRYEPECMNTLQSKSVPVEVRPDQEDVCLTSIQKKAHIVSTQFALLCQKLEDYHLEQVTPVTKSLVMYIQNFIRDHCQRIITSKESKSSVSHQVRVVDQICTRLLEICSKSSHSPALPTFYEDEEMSDNVDQNFIREIIQVVTALGHAFTKLVDILLCCGVEGIVHELETARSPDEALDVILHLTELGVDGGHICKIVGRVGGIQALLNVCMQPSYREIRSQTLRALATVCCVAEGIAHFEKQGGVEVLSRVLSCPDSTEEERSESAGVLAQITSPWVEDNLSFPCLDGHLSQLVNSITDLANETTSTDVFLLASAALANLTFLDSNCIEALLQASTHRILLEKLNKLPHITVFIKDQIATVLANLSSTPSAASVIMDAGCLPVLVSLLNTRPSEASRLPEVAAAERVQQKSAIAISRLCTDNNAAREVLKMGGANRLAHLCKNETERNYSDAVLVACLAALRKMATACGHEQFQGVDAKELVEPRLLDSFLIYSSQQESYV